MLAPYDLTRPGSGVGLYGYRGHADIKETALYVQDTITLKNLTLNLGLRGDLYYGISTASQAEPRVGAAYNIKQTNTVLQFSYARTLETPFNENLVLASNGCNDAVVNAISAVLQGYPCLNVPLSPSTRNEYHAGLQQAFGKWVVVDGEYIWKYTDQGVRFQCVWQHSGHLSDRVGQLEDTRLCGARQRAELPRVDGLHGFLIGGGAFLRTAGQRYRRHANFGGINRGVPHRSR